jgi:redox-sensing transcriptional repressor
MVCDDMVSAGIGAILNFAPIQVKAPEEVLVKTVDLKIHLEELSFYLTHSEAGSPSGVTAADVNRQMD